MTRHFEGDLGPAEMSVDEAARALGVGRSAVRKAIARGQLPARLVDGKFGPEYTIASSSIEAYRRRSGRARRLREVEA